MIKIYSEILPDQDATVVMGCRLAKSLTSSTIIFLHGDLGAGKTTFSRGVIQGLGHNGNVKSPTYTLVEPYELSGLNAYHFDLYRLSEPEELEYMGFRDYLNDHAVCLIEWPEKGAGLLPKPDLVIELQYAEQQREVTFKAGTELGETILQRLKNEI
ncbi:tRNA (adenosine(37)-N6)-threonylcarbamoyltransferase complex ATPase subunit type 1 TsaE [Psychrosphaera algicola]|uniref:tRNA (adenosine(37)-N6)-threonylcarbamoyltransferase complex ATPase subunit type 1 TsaE n=1 Tax=Psychrosphaera algicola TaxID=3023714 RepID=UPI00351D1E73